MPDIATGRRARVHAGARSAGSRVRQNNGKFAYKYSIGDGYKVSNGWEPLGPAGSYDRFGPKLGFGRALQDKLSGNIAIAKFAHSGSQMNGWTPEGSLANSRHLYPHFIAFVENIDTSSIVRPAK